MAAPGYVTLHCDGAARLCTTAEPCGSSYYAARCPASASVSEYPSVETPTDGSGHCTAPLMPCDANCYDPRTQICCVNSGLSGSTFTYRACYIGDECARTGQLVCDDTDRMSPP